jgi:uncharacterized protein YajQ (UPF0234 family)
MPTDNFFNPLAIASTNNQAKYQGQMSGTNVRVRDRPRDAIQIAIQIIV